ncbi:hypothetical protein D3C81_1924250 [compost metagenome]
MRNLALEAKRAVVTFDESLRLLDEVLLEDSHQVVGCLLVVLFAVVTLDQAAPTDLPHAAFRLGLGRLDLQGHLVAGVAQLIQGQCFHPLVGADPHRVAVLALNFRHGDSSPAHVGGLEL